MAAPVRRRSRSLGGSCSLGARSSGDTAGLVVRLRAPVRHSGSVPRLSQGLEMIAPDKAEFMLAISSRALFAVNRLRSRAALRSSSVQVGMRRASAHPKDGPQGSNGACARRTGVCLHLLQDGRSKALREKTLLWLVGILDHAFDRVSLSDTPAYKAESASQIREANRHNRETT